MDPRLLRVYISPLLLPLGGAGAVSADMMGN
jgi:hypothetical protein